MHGCTPVALWCQLGCSGSMPLTPACTCKASRRTELFQQPDNASALAAGPQFFDEPSQRPACFCKRTAALGISTLFKRVALDAPGISCNRYCRHGRLLSRRAGCSALSSVLSGCLAQLCPFCALLHQMQPCRSRLARRCKLMSGSCPGPCPPPLQEQCGLLACDINIDVWRQARLMWNGARSSTALSPCCSRGCAMFPCSAAHCCRGVLRCQIRKQFCKGMPIR